MRACGCRSRVFFLWATPLFRLGFRRPLTLDDLWGLGCGRHLLPLCREVAGVGTSTRPPCDACSRTERAEFACAKLSAAWEAELTQHGDSASLARAVRRAWRAWYFTPVVWSCLWIFFSCLSTAVLMRTMILWFELRDHSRSYIVGIALAMVCTEICKVVLVGGRVGCSRVARVETGPCAGVCSPSAWARCGSPRLWAASKCALPCEDSCLIRSCGCA